MSDRKYFIITLLILKKYNIDKQMILKTYLSTNKITYEEFAKLIGVSGKNVIYQYCNNQRIPRPDIQKRIFEITKGKVSPSDFVLSKNKGTLYDLEVLNRLLWEKNIQHKFLAIMLGISASAISQKLAGKIPFKYKEIEKIFEIMDNASTKSR